MTSDWFFDRTHQVAFVTLVAAIAVLLLVVARIVRRVDAESSGWVEAPRSPIFVGVGHEQRSRQERGQAKRAVRLSHAPDETRSEGSTSGDDADENTPEDTPRQPVEFIVLAPAAVPPSRPFRVHVNVQNFTPPPEDHTSGPSFVNHETMVARVLSGAPIGLVVLMDQTKFDTDVQFQALLWERRNLVATFHIRSRPTHGRTDTSNTAWIVLNGMPLGRIDFATTIDPKLKAPTSEREFSPQTEVAQHVSKQFDQARVLGLARANPIRNAFVCYAHKDWFLVGTMCRGLEGAGVNCWIDALNMKRNPHWLEQVKAFLSMADTVYLFWSEDADTPSLADEHELIRTELDNRRVNRRQPLDLIVMPLIDKPDPPAWALRQDGYNRSWDLFRAWHTTRGVSKAYNPVSVPYPVVSR